MARRERMDEDALAALVDHQIADARQFATSDLITGRDRALEYVRGEINDIPSEPGKSSVTSRDLSDVLNWIMPGLLRVFLASDQVVRYEPNKREIGPDGNDLSKERAEQATDYVNYVFLNECNGYRVVSSGSYDGLLLGNGIVKHWWDHTPEYETKTFTGLTDDQYLFLCSHPDVEKVLEHTERQEWEPGASEPDHGPAQIPAPAAPAAPQPSPDAAAMPGNGEAAPGNGPEQGIVPAPPVPIDVALQPQTLHDCKIKRRVSSGRLRVEALPPEEFLITRRARALDETVPGCGHRYKRTRSDLIEMGLPKEKVDDLPAAGIDWDDTTAFSRDGTYTGGTQGTYTGGTQATSGEGDRSMELVDIYEWYLLVDYDGDGIAERRKILKGDRAGDAGLLSNEEWEDDLPFSDLVPEPVPHQWKGRSLYDELQDVVRVKTTLVRQTLDNLYMTNNPMTQVLENSVSNMDALINRRIGANIFVKQEGAIAPIEQPFTAKESFGMLEYWDQIIEKRTGVSRSTMGMDPDALQNQTAEAVRDSRAASATKTESYARNIAELGMKRMFRCILNLITKHQDRPRTIRLRGKWVEMSPNLWDPNMDVSVNTGLGTGSRDRDLMLLQGVLSKQELILQTMGPDNPVVGLEEYRNTLAKAAETSGLRGTEQYFKEVTPEALQQMAEANKAKPDPKMAEVEAKMQLEQQKAAHDMQVKEAVATHDAQMRQAQAQADLQHKQMELAAKGQFDREKAAADMQTLRDKAAAEIEAMRERNQLELQLAREKAHQEMILKAEELRMEAQLKREEMQILGRQQASSNIQEAAPQ